MQMVVHEENREEYLTNVGMQLTKHVVIFVREYCRVANYKTMACNNAA